ncbi:acyl-CoA synthetase, partial [Mycobacterium sp. ITM-2017-0098]
ERLSSDTVAVRYGDQTWTWREHLAEATAEASALIALADPARPPPWIAASPACFPAARRRAAAALGGYVLGGINTTRRGDGLLADIRRSDCQLLLINPDHRSM